MRIDQFVNAVFTSLEQWAVDNKGRASVATDPLNALELLVFGPRGVHVSLFWAGDDDVGGAKGVAECANRLEITVGFSLGLDPNEGYGLFKSRGSRPNLLQLVNDCRKHVLAMRFPSESNPVDELTTYGGCQPVALPTGDPLAAYKFTVTFDSAMDTADEWVDLDEPDET